MNGHGCDQDRIQARVAWALQEGRVPLLCCDPHAVHDPGTWSVMIVITMVRVTPPGTLWQMGDLTMSPQMVSPGWVIHPTSLESTMTAIITTATITTVQRVIIPSPTPHAKLLPSVSLAAVMTIHSLFPGHVASSQGRVRVRTFKSGRSSWTAILCAQYQGTLSSAKSCDNKDDEYNRCRERREPCKGGIVRTLLTHCSAGTRSTSG